MFVFRALKMVKDHHQHHSVYVVGKSSTHQKDKENQEPIPQDRRWQGRNGEPTRLVTVSTRYYVPGVPKFRAFAQKQTLAFRSYSSLTLVISGLKDNLVLVQPKELINHGFLIPGKTNRTFGSACASGVPTAGDKVNSKNQPIGIFKILSSTRRSPLCFKFLQITANLSQRRGLIGPGSRSCHNNLFVTDTVLRSTENIQSTVLRTEYRALPKIGQTSPFSSYWTWAFALAPGGIRSTPPRYRRMNDEFCRCSSEHHNKKSSTSNASSNKYIQYSVHTEYKCPGSLSLYGSHLSIRTLQSVPNCTYVWLRNLYS